MKMNAGNQPFTISNLQSFSRSSVVMKATTAAQMEKDTDEEYFEQNIPIRPRMLENKDTENYWDNLMKNREPLKLPYWVEENGM